MTESLKDISDPKERQRQRELEQLFRELRKLEKMEELVREKLGKQAEKKND